MGSGSEIDATPHHNRAIAGRERNYVDCLIDILANSLSATDVRVLHGAIDNLPPACYLKPADGERANLPWPGPNHGPSTARSNRGAISPVPRYGTTGPGLKHRSGTE
jgi:hypothetical protein